MKPLLVPLLPFLLKASSAELLRADKPTNREGNDVSVPTARDSEAPIRNRRLFNVFNLQSLLDDTTKTEEAIDDSSFESGRSYFNLFTNIFTGERDPSTSESPANEKPASSKEEKEEEVVPKVEDATLAPTRAPVEKQTAQPVTAEKVKETAKNFLETYTGGWVPKPEGSYSEIFLSVFAARTVNPTVSPAPTMSPAPSGVPSIPPVAGTEGPTTTVFPTTGTTIAPSLIPSSQIQTVLPSEQGSPVPSLAPNALSGAPTSSFSPTYSQLPTLAGTGSEDPTLSQVPTSISPSSSLAPSLVPSSNIIASIKPSVSAAPSITALPSASRAPSSTAQPFGSVQPSRSSPPTVSESPSALPTSNSTTSVPPSLGPTTTTAPTLARVEGGFTTELNLDQVPETYRQVFTAAAARWDTVIVGDLQDFVMTDADRATAGSRCDASTIPDVIDDVFICSSLPSIDGEIGILGSAGPLLARSGEILQTSVGYMQFDLADIDILNANGQLAGTILHEMAHVYGIGTLWGPNSLVENTDICAYRYDSKASEEYRALSGCDGAVPIETDGAEGTKCLHWDEDCFQSELMTGVNTGDQELSRITVAGLEDLGYTVDYSQATPYPSSLLAPSCNCNANRNLNADIFFNERRALQTETTTVARLNAIDYGRSQLRSFRAAALGGNSVYLGDKVIVVLYWDDGVKSVVVQSDT